MILKIAKHKWGSYNTILAGDIGGSKADLAICSWDGSDLSLLKSITYKTKDFKDINAMLREFVSNEKMPEKICLGVAGPVQNGAVSLTNIGLEISSEEISKNFNDIPVELVNDLEAAGNGLAVIGEKDIHILQEGDKEALGNVALIAPGTGLGEGGLYHDRSGYHPFATEGGHCDFAPRTEMDLELYQFLKKKFNHVSWERVVSGPGISVVYDFLHHEKEREEPAWLKEKMLAHDKATVISGHADDCEICKETMELFFRYLAEESANLVLKLKATGGLFIGGGIIAHLLPILNKDYFLKWFCQYGRMKNLLKTVPVKIILNEKTPVLGAAYHGVHTSY